jgi:hypothetical protein
MRIYDVWWFDFWALVFEVDDAVGVLVPHARFCIWNHDNSPSRQLGE